MALRHLISLDNAAVKRDEPGKVVPRYPAPGRVEFRPGSNIVSVVEQLMQCERVQLCAAVGAGKSVKVPEALVHHTKGLVVHCVPSALLALSLHKYVSTVTKVDTFFVDGDHGPLPRKGIAFTSAADFVRRLIERRTSGEVLPSYVLFLDECHESDFATEVLRSLGTDLEGCSNLVLSSATFDPEGARRVEAAGKRVDRVLPDIDVTDWDPEEDGKPWAVSALDHDALLFVEQPREVARLRTAYEENGFTVFVLTARMARQAFEHAMAVLARKNRSVVVLLADYSFRSGYTFPSVGVVIDAGEVAFCGEHEGAPTRMYRRAYRFEVEQAAGRGGRVAGTSCVCWSPGKPEATICDVDGTEADAVPLIYRMLGYKPPKKYSGARFFSGDVPDDMAEALKGKMPLFAWRAERLTSWEGGYSREKVEPPPRRAISPSSCVSRPNFKMPLMPDGTSRVFTPPSPQMLPTAEIRPSSRSGAGSPELEEVIAPLPKSAAAHSFVAESPSIMAPEVVVENGRGSVAGPSFGHSRSLTDSSVESVPRFDAASEARDALAEMIEQMSSTEHGGLVLGDYTYMPGVEACEDAMRWFPGGTQSVSRMAQDPHVLGGMEYVQKINALRLLLDAHNDAVARLRAVKRLTEAMPDVAGTIGSLVRPKDLRTWLEGLSEMCIEDEAKAKSLADDMLRLFRAGYRRPSAPVMAVFNDREVEYVKGFIHQLEFLVYDGDPEGQDKYAGLVRDRPREGGILKSVTQKAIMPSEYKGAVRSVKQIEPARARDLVHVPSSRTETVAKYRLQPASGLPSLLARALIKAVGEGDVRVQVK